MGGLNLLSHPAPIHDGHDVSLFDSGEPSLDEWLRKRARQNQSSGASRTFVVCVDARVVAYYSLSSGVVTVSSATGRFRRNMPNPIQVVFVARLAIDRNWQGQGLGRALMRDALCRIASAADLIGIRGVAVHAISEKAKAFYLKLGFDESPVEPLMLMITLADLLAAL